MSKPLKIPVWIAVLALAGSGCWNRCIAGVNSNSGKASLTILDEATDETVPCRVHLVDGEGKPQLSDHLPSFRDHFCCDGKASLTLPAGSYNYVIERGCEYERCKGSFAIRNGDLTNVTEKLKRIADMASEGWWSGDLHVHRPAEDIELLMAAEDLHVAPIITWWNRSNIWSGSKLPERRVVRFDGQRFCDLLGGEDERAGGAFMYFNMQAPVDITRAESEYPCPLHFVEQAGTQPNAWMDIEKPFWWDVPVALAYGRCDSIGLLNNHCLRSGMLDNEAWGRSRPKEQFPSPQGNGFWSQHIYYHILNSGIRIAPTAGSASGVLTNPVGYNRVYVYTGSRNLEYSEWWENLRRGVSFVTNGPLILASASGRRPGHIFTADEDREIEIELELSVISNDPVGRIEIIKNGSIEKTIRPDNLGKDGRLGTVRFTRSGWFLIRLIADVPHTFRFASTAPYYVEIGSEKRYLSRESIRFFLDWVDQRIQRIDIKDSGKLEDVLKYHSKARQFWLERLDSANVD